MFARVLSWRRIAGMKFLEGAPESAGHHQLRPTKVEVWIDTGPRRFDAVTGYVQMLPVRRSGERIMEAAGVCMEPANHEFLTVNTGPTSLRQR